MALASHLSHKGKGTVGILNVFLLHFQIPGTVSISEPEVLLPFVAGSTLTKADPREGEERSKLLRACIEVLCVTAINRKLKDGVKNISYVVIKPKVVSKRIETLTC